MGLSHQKLTPLAHSLLPLAFRRPHLKYTMVCVCVCVCVCVIYVYLTLTIFYTFTVLDYFRLPDPLLFQLYADSDVSFALRQLLACTESFYLYFSYSVIPRNVHAI